ncbi:hypothetical protein Tco_0453132 [Tanacetum coccineum]
MALWKWSNPPYKFKWAERTIPIAEGSSETTTEGYMENYKNVSQDIRNQLDAKAEAVLDFMNKWCCGFYNVSSLCPSPSVSMEKDLAILRVLEDDLLMFFHGDIISVSMVKEAIKDFGVIFSFFPIIAKVVSSLEGSLWRINTAS